MSEFLKNGWDEVGQGYRAGNNNQEGTGKMTDKVDLNGGVSKIK